MCTHRIFYCRKFSVVLPKFIFPPKESTTSPLATTRLLLGGMPEPLALDCEQKLVYKEGFNNVRDIAECPPTLYHRAYLTNIGITGLGIQQQLLRLHNELPAQYQHTGKISHSHLCI